MRFRHFFIFIPLIFILSVIGVIQASGEVLPDGARKAPKSPLLDLPRSFYKHLKGKMVEGGQITYFYMNFRRAGDEVVGTVFYDNKPDCTYLQGKMDDMGKFQLLEYDPYMYLLGKYNGQFMTETTAKGTWGDADQLKKNTIELTENYDNSVKFENWDYDEVYHLYGQADMPYITVQLSYLHPIEYIPNAASLPTVSNNVLFKYFGEYTVPGEVETNLMNKKEDYMSDYKGYVEREYQASSDVDKSVYIWDINSRCDVLFNDKEILSLAFNAQEDVGGVAGFGGVTYCSFNLKDGTEITIDQIFRPGYENVLTAEIHKKALLWHGYEESDNVELKGFEVDMLIPKETFFIDKSGIGFYYGPYEVYEAETKVYIPFTALKSVLKPVGPVANLLK